MLKQDISRLRSLPIESVAERLGLGVAKHKSLCPFHDDHHASLTFSTRRNTYRCFACGASGDTIDLVMKSLGKPFTEACQWLADGTNIILENRKPAAETPARQTPPFDAARYMRHFEHPWLSPEARRFLFEERRLNSKVVEWCRLTSWTDRRGTHWLEIPYFDMQGKLVGVQNRNLDYSKSSPGSTRFRFVHGQRCTIYNMPVIPMLRQGEELFITEGASDCWAMLSSGHKAIAVPSATLLSPSDKLLLQHLALTTGTSFHMFPDGDAPGERLFLQLEAILPNIRRHQLPEGCKDFADAYKVSFGSFG